MQGNYFSIVPAVQGNWQGFNIGTLTPVIFSVVGVGLRAGCYHQLVPTGGHTRALKIKKSQSPPIPVVGAVDTNVWSIKGSRDKSKQRGFFFYIFRHFKLHSTSSIARQH